MEGNETKLQCEITNVGPGHKLSVLWIRDPGHQNVTELNHESKKNVTERNHLTVIPHRKDNGAQYSCAAVLNLQQRQVYQSQPINITVHYKPVIVEPVGGNLSVTEGEMLVLRCLADSNPPSGYSWSLSDNDYIKNSSITISRARLQDQGSYTCTASNDLGSTSVTVDIIVTDKLA
ncbi:sialic acid-binding Ig-like lectin 5 isoform X2 [Trichomycterus rosablanca]|uniref:sialic acid-binding Ig-like lectin 5 isoform X2 n=1 Tax=Trichomycterus rosablanca TaxID=2290929 RepID=UPI002F3573BF